jgi:hypothetical protein
MIMVESVPGVGVLLVLVTGSGGDESAVWGRSHEVRWSMKEPRVLLSEVDAVIKWSGPCCSLPQSPRG